MERYNLQQNIKRRRCRLKAKDSFSCLPDDIIVSHILSRLMPREAASCSFISRRWRNLWQQIISCRFIFLSSQAKHYWSSTDVIAKERQRYVSWVNEFVDFPQHNPTIDEFIVRFDLGSTYSSDINKWLNFAFNKGVKRLELNFSPFRDPYSDSPNPHRYAFPSVKTLSGLHTLRDICFKNVNIDGEAIEFILSKCHSLERLRVKGSNTLINLNVCSESVALKHLQIVDCPIAETVNISVPSLVSLKYSGPRRALRVGHVPSLSELCIGGDYCRAFLRRKATNLDCISQLKKIKLDMTYKVVRKCVNYPVEFPTFISLKHLEVKMEMYNGLFLLWPIILINAAPALHTFSVKLKPVVHKVARAWCKRKSRMPLHWVVVGSTRLTEEARIRILTAIKNTRKRLKTVEIHNFVGNDSDLQLIARLLRFRSVEKLILFTSSSALFPFDDDPCGQFYQERSREQGRIGISRIRSTQVIVH